MLRASRRFLSLQSGEGARAGRVMSVEEVRAALDAPHAWNRVPEGVKEKVGRGLLHEAGHPLHTLKEIIAAHWGALPGTRAASDSVNYTLFDRLSPVVTVRQNFDELLTPPTHVSRRPTDTYYLTDETLLRCHTSAHQTELLRAGQRAFLVAGDVYRRDAVDATHYPIFHQMEGVRVFSDAEVDPAWPRARKVEFVVEHLKTGLEGTVRALFGDVKTRWNAESFPFTDPSLELEVEFRGEWLEVLGCGMIAQGVMDNARLPAQVGWAFGLGLERLAMRLFDIPDIRLFWSRDERFLAQFRSGDRAARFQPFSKFPACYKDVAFWVPDEFNENDFFEIVRDVAGDLAESVVLIDKFHNPKRAAFATSYCFRINYRSLERSLTNEEVDKLQARVRQAAADQKLQLR